jgi:hypothetical protein
MFDFQLIWSQCGKNNQNLNRSISFLSQFYNIVLKFWQIKNYKQNHNKIRKKKTIKILIGNKVNKWRNIWIEYSWLFNFLMLWYFAILVCTDILNSNNTRWNCLQGETCFNRLYYAPKISIILRNQNFSFHAEFS